MKKYIVYVIALGIVTIWAIFACIYIGVEDGSSGLSIFGKLCGIFFIPGGIILTHGGSFSNADIPFAAIISWFIFALIIVGIVQIVRILCKYKKESKTVME